MTFEQLRVLHAIVTEGTFRRAAETLFKSQPALSTMIISSNFKNWGCHRIEYRRFG